MSLIIIDLFMLSIIKDKNHISDSLIAFSCQKLSQINWIIKIVSFKIVNVGQEK